VLVTGGAGFIGCALARRLVDRGVRVTVMDSLHPQVHARPIRPRSLPDEVVLKRRDVTDADHWIEVLEEAQPDTVVHLAAETGTGQSLCMASRHGMVNVVGTTRLVDALSRAQHSVRHIVLASSRAVYGEGEWLRDDGHVVAPGPRLEVDMTAGRWAPILAVGAAAAPVPHRASVTSSRPVSVYGVTKLAQENLLAVWAASTGVALSTLRLQNVYGPGQSLTNAYTGVLTWFARQSLGGSPIEVYEDGRIVRDFVYIDDVAAAFDAAIASPPVAPRLVDIGSGQPTTLLAVARAIARKVDGSPPQVSGRFRVGDVRAASCDTTDAAAELGYRAMRSLEDGLDALLDWVRVMQVG
jgi:dTDP-L-rhamnose 4-epimerase